MGSSQLKVTLRERCESETRHVLYDVTTGIDINLYGYRYPLVIACILKITDFLRNVTELVRNKNREVHRFTLNLHGLMMMIVENIPDIFLSETSYSMRNK